MKQLQFKSVLRSAVIAAIPLATQVGCGATGAAEAGGVKGTTPPPTGGANETANKAQDPCRAGETTRKSGQESYSAQTKLVSESLTADQCIALCKQVFEQQRIGGVFNDLIKLESIEASNCQTENRPYSIALPGGKYPTPSTQVSCDVSYTALHSPYTCPRPVVGRIPNGLHVEAADTPDSIGEYLADMAVMETAAISAFEYLSRELAVYGAPAELIARAREAVAEETRHAEMTGLLSAAYATEVPAVTVDAFALRSIYEIALENAVEGCVNETFAAACGVWQSQHAQLDVFRQVIEHISDEELGHAALSWDIHQWIMPQLSESEQQQIMAAQAEAVERLMHDFRQEGNPTLQQAFGLPTRDEAKRLFTQLKQSVWHAIAPSGFVVNSQRLLA